MLREKNSELSVGLFMLIAFFALLFVTVQTSSLNFKNQSAAYSLSASFIDINGLRAKAPVRIAGVKIGEVQSIVLNKSTYQADINVTIYSKQVEIPKDSTISILTEGVVGSKFISIEPGFDNTMLTNNSVIEKTKPSLSVEQVINQAIAAFTSQGGANP